MYEAGDIQNIRQWRMNADGKGMRIVSHKQYWDAEEKLLSPEDRERLKNKRRGITVTEKGGIIT